MDSPITEWVQDSPVFTFPPLERVAVMGNFVKSLNFVSIWCISVCS